MTHFTRAVSARWASAIALPLLWACSEENEQQFDVRHQAAITDSVQAFYDEFQAVVGSNDWNGIVEFYADDERLLVLEDGRFAYRSRAEIERSMASMVGVFDTAELKISDRVIEPLAPGVATSTSLYTQSFSNDSASFSYSGAMSHTLVHTAQGWKILSAHVSTLGEWDEN